MFNIHMNQVLDNIQLIYNRKKYIEQIIQKKEKINV